MELEGRHGIHQPAQYDFAIPECRQSERGNDRYALFRLDERDLCVQKIDHRTDVYPDAGLCEVLLIPPPAQRFMSKRMGAKVVEVAGSHSVYVSQPKAVVKLIEHAAKDVGSK